MKNKNQAAVFSANLKGIRGYLSKAEFGRAIGCPHATQYHYYERGTTPRREMLQRIAEKLCVTIDEITLEPLSFDRCKEIRDHFIQSRVEAQKKEDSIIETLDRVEIKLNALAKLLEGAK